MGGRSEQVLSLAYSPLAEAEGTGSILISSPEQPDYWYALKLACHESSSIRVPQFKTELGNIDRYQVQIHNPLSSDVMVKVRKSNGSVFYTEPEEIKLAGQATTKFSLVYSPSNLSLQSGEIILTTQKIGSWNYMLYGVGTPPTEAETICIEANLYEDKITFINFKNPFKDAIEVSISLEYEDPVPQDTFRIILKNTTLQIEEGAALQIPVIFVPHSMRHYLTKLRIFMNEKINWVFPIKGTTIFISERQSRLFRCRCREVRKEVFEALLEEYGGSRAHLRDSAFRVELRGFSGVEEQLLAGSLTIEDVARPDGDSWQWLVSLAPMKPFKAMG